MLNSSSSNAIKNFSFKYKNDIEIDEHASSNYSKIGAITIDRQMKIATIENLCPQTPVVFYEK
jgi:hypothetical protein